MRKDRILSLKLLTRLKAFITFKLLFESLFFYIKKFIFVNKEFIFLKSSALISRINVLCYKTTRLICYITGRGRSKYIKMLSRQKFKEYHNFGLIHS